MAAAFGNSAPPAHFMKESRLSRAGDELLPQRLLEVEKRAHLDARDFWLD
jgi:hypothetical protein